jgi:hypothetical protein
MLKKLCLVLLSTIERFKQFIEFKLVRIKEREFEKPMRSGWDFELKKFRLSVEHK